MEGLGCLHNALPFRGVCSPAAKRKSPKESGTARKEIIFLSVPLPNVSQSVVLGLQVQQHLRA